MESNTRAEQLLTVTEVAKLWKCCIRTVTRKVERGELEIVRLSDSMIRIRESVAARHVQERTMVEA
jgi:excisionase family DNA binding protein